MIPTTNKFVIVSAKESGIKSLKEAILRGFPNSSIETTPFAESLKEGDIYILDATSARDQKKVIEALEQLSGSTCIVVIKTLNDFMGLREYLSDQHQAVTSSEINGMHFINSINNILQIRQLNDQIRNLSEQVKRASTTDEVTSLSNEKRFLEIADREMKKSNRYKRPLCAVVFSMTGSGDKAKLSKLVAATIQKTIREVDFPARCSETEFAVLLPETSETDAAKVAARLHANIEKSCADYKPAVHYGISSLSEATNESSILLNNAMLALNQSKNGMSGTITAYSDMNAGKKLFKESCEAAKEINSKVAQISKEAERSFFQSLLRVVSDNPFGRRYLLPHSERVAFFAEQLGQKEGLPYTSLLALRRAGFLHDIGKLAIDTKLFMKEGHLTDDEFGLVRQHSGLGAKMLESSAMFSAEKEAIRHHHERFDGFGYPDRLAGEKISIEARILGIAEAWDTMINSQPYRPAAMSMDAALSELLSQAGKQFDPGLIDKFILLITN